MGGEGVEFLRGLDEMERECASRKILIVITVRFRGLTCCLSEYSVPRCTRWRQSGPSLDERDQEVDYDWLAFQSKEFSNLRSGQHA